MFALQRRAGHGSQLIAEIVLVESAARHASLLELIEYVVQLLLVPDATDNKIMSFERVVEGLGGRDRGMSGLDDSMGGRQISPQQDVDVGRSGTGGLLGYSQTVHDRPPE